MSDGLINILPTLNDGSIAGGPLYVKLQRLIENAVLDGLLKPGDALPPERELAAIADISRVTVRKAVQGLVSDGLLIQRHGSGTFVAPRSARVEQSLTHLTSFTEDMARRGMVVRSTWLDRGIYVPSPEEMVTLGLTSGERVSRISRLRVANDTPMAIERAALSVHVLPNPELVTLSLYAVLAASGNRPVRAIQRISAAILKENDAKLLEVPVGSASLNIERISYLDSGKVIEFTRSIYRADAYEFVAELKLGDSSEISGAVL
ncbi:GntR family transcriptional regulator [Phyllobacterium ifriqiyense]|uniref:GntR family transcriptional regulator n=1 Tax=Phyllobacterium ifriqiyense TaxID=314238 RepID=A0ABU0S6U2_9HYPH|nr:GntR family transcriptional regulator [Phyllobacterium ifriqiyense]MDQ0996465.1 GntR family transcriptional regulator [Phyllobacterium ifriqiyense]